MVLLSMVTSCVSGMDKTGRLTTIGRTSSASLRYAEKEKEKRGSPQHVSILRATFGLFGLLSRKCLPLCLLCKQLFSFQLVCFDLQIKHHL